MLNRAGAILVVLATVLVPLRAGAQDAPSGRLTVTVADPSGAVIPRATVTVTGQEEATRAVSTDPVLTSDVGEVSFDGLVPGAYTIRAEFPGFEIIEIREYRVRSGDNRRTVTLPIGQVAEDLTVGRDGQTAGLDPRGNAFSTVLTREQIEALPDDPDEMEAVLRAMAPPGATFRVDGFTGGRLPPKSQIRSIRLPRMDAFAAQNHGGMNGALHIDIMTQPGNGPLRGSLDFAFRDDALNARNPFTPVKGDEGLKQGGVTFGGTIVPNRSSFSLSAQYSSIFNTGNLLAAVPGSTRAEPVRQPVDRAYFNAKFDQALGPDHMLRVSFQRDETDSRNLGVGSYDLPERAYATDRAENFVRVSENGPIGRTAFSESRLQVRWTSDSTSSAVESPTIRVLDAFTSGGAQRTGGSSVFEIEAATDLDVVRGAHSFRTGVLLEGGRYRSDAFSDYLGTYTFASLEDFEAGRPSSFTQRIGDPEIRYSNLQVGLYAQDDYRISRSLLLSYGLRYEAQKLIADQNNFSPRASLSWSPLSSGATTLRGSVGYFPDWLGTGTFEQTLRVDGFRQQELNIIDPGFPVAGAAGATPPTNRYVLNDALALPNSFAMNAGVDQQVGPLRLSTTYSYRRGLTLLRGRNLNAPVNGARPDLAFSNVVDVVNDAKSRSHSLMFHGNLMLLEQRQTFLMVFYALTATEANSTGAFSLPATGDDLDGEWGPSVPRHRAGAMFSTNPFARFGVAVNLRAASGSPYTTTTGTDVNGDGVFTDRPDGVGRNTALTASEWDVGLRLSYTFGFGGPPRAGGGGVAVVVRSGEGGGMPTGGISRRGQDRYRIEVYAAAQNITNHANYIGYSGVITSPFFGTPTNVRNPRKIELGMRFGF